MKNKGRLWIPYLGRRWRVLIVLLIFSLTPCLAVTLICQSTADRFAGNMLHSMEASLTEIVGKELQQTAKCYGKKLSGELATLQPGRSESGIEGCGLMLPKVQKIGGLFSQWAPFLGGFIVCFKKVGRNIDESTLHILATGDFRQEEPCWQPAALTQRLRSSDIKGLGRLLRALDSGANGYLESAYEGVASIWAYEHIRENLHLVLVLPKSRIRNQVQHSGDLLALLTRRQWLVIGGAAALLILLVVITAFWSSRSMTRPLQVMVEAIERLAGGDFSSRMEFASGDEREFLASAFNEMVPQLEDRLRIRNSLQVAKEVQQSLLPREIPKFRGFDLSATAIYCEETGGDYLDFFPCGSDCERLGVAIGDVSGHGVPAALLMTTARALLRMRSSQPGSMAQIVTSVNRLLSADTCESGRFMTLFYLHMDPANRTLHWVRAGHQPGIFYDPVTESFDELLGRGIALGVDEAWQYEENERSGLASGQRDVRQAAAVRSYSAECRKRRQGNRKSSAPSRCAVSRRVRTRG